MQNLIYLSTAGAVSLTSAAGDVLTIDYELHDHLGDSAVLDVALSLLSGATTPTPDSTVVQLTWRDSATDDVIYRVKGVAGLPIENPMSLLSVADATEAFASIDVTAVVTGFTTAVLASDAYNAPNTRGREKITVALPDDQPAAFDATALFNALTLMEPRPSYLVLPVDDDLPVLAAVLRATEKLNIPLDIELDPSLTVAQAAAAAIAIEADDHRVATYWSPILARSVTAISTRGPKKLRRAIGQILGMKLLRNARTNAEGISPIHVPVAGADFPLSFNSMEMRPDIVLDDDALEILAKAKVNVIRRIPYDIGSLFVVSDVLTQYSSASSALRLTNAAEIACFTTNVVIDILRRHMLKKMSGYLVDASKDIELFLNKCVSAGLLQPADDLSGQPYEFSLIPDQTMPFERVRLVLKRRPEGAVRSAIFDDDVIVK